MWEIEYTDEFDQWWQTLTEKERIDLTATIEMLEQFGPKLARPYADTVKGSKHPNMKELRTQSGGQPLRTLYAFDPRRCAILLIGGAKTGDDCFYDKMVPLVDLLYDEYLKELKDEGLI